MYILKVKERKVRRVREEFLRLGHICDVVRVTGYSRTLIHCVVNNCFEVIPEDFKDHIPNDTCNMDSLPAPKQANMENFGGLQHIIDRMPDKEQFVLTRYFVHGWTKTRIADWLGQSRKVVDRILRNLRKVDLEKS